MNKPDRTEAIKAQRAEAYRKPRCRDCDGRLNLDLPRCPHCGSSNHMFGPVKQYRAAIRRRRQMRLEAAEKAKEKKSC